MRGAAFALFLILSTLLVLALDRPRGNPTDTETEMGTVVLSTVANGLSAFHATYRRHPTTDEWLQALFSTRAVAAAGSLTAAAAGTGPSEHLTRLAAASTALPWGVVFENRANEPPERFARSLASEPAAEQRGWLPRPERRQGDPWLRELGEGRLLYSTAFREHCKGMGPERGEDSEGPTLLVLAGLTGVAGFAWLRAVAAQRSRGRFLVEALVIVGLPLGLLVLTATSSDNHNLALIGQALGVPPAPPRGSGGPVVATRLLEDLRERGLVGPDLYPRLLSSARRERGAP